MAAYVPTSWQNYAAGGTPMSAANLNHLTDELELQAASLGIIHSLPNWANGAPPALTDATSLNEMENVTAQVASQLGLSYTKTTWQAGWTPGRNAYNLNKLETAAQAARVLLDAAPPVGDLLTWAPPGLTPGANPKLASSYPGYNVRHINNSTLTIATTVGSNQDVFIIWDEVVNNVGGEKRVIIQGWRNVVLIGGERNNTNAVAQSNGAGIQIDRCNGIVHIEGVKMHGPGQMDCFVTTSGKGTSFPGCDLRIQNCFVHNNAISDVHADGFQLWSSPGGGWTGGVGSLKSDRFTLHTTWQGIFLGTHDGTIQSFDLRNTNIVGVPHISPATHDGNGWIFFKGCYPDIGGYSGTGTVSNFWIDNEIYRLQTGVAYVNNVTPNSVGSDGSGGTACGRANQTARQCKQGTDAQGTYINWPNAGSDIGGKMYIGRPPSSLGGLPGDYTTTGAAFGNNDFCPHTVPGMSYVSPGYQP